jgi:hypothetical protein
VFVRAGRTYQALAAWERALEWRVLFSLAISSGLSKEEIQEIGYRIAGQSSVMVTPAKVLIFVQRTSARRSDMRKQGVSS